MSLYQVGVCGHGARAGIRTPNILVLSQVPLPVGLHEQKQGNDLEKWGKKGYWQDYGYLRLAIRVDGRSASAMLKPLVSQPAPDTRVGVRNTLGGRGWI